MALKNLRVGDMVREENFSRDLNNCTGRVVDRIPIQHNGVLVTVRYAQTARVYRTDHEGEDEALCLIDATPGPRFLVGDKVRIKEGVNGAGMVFRVVGEAFAFNGPKSHWWVPVLSDKNPDADPDLFKASCLESVPEHPPRVTQLDRDSIISRLPKTEDGVPVLPDDRVYIELTVGDAKGLMWKEWHHDYVSQYRCWSTAEACIKGEAAKRSEQM